MSAASKGRAAASAAKGTPSAACGRAPREALPARQEIAALAASRPFRNACTWFRKNAAEVLRWQQEVCSIPAPPFGEARRAAWLKAKFQELGLQQVQVDLAGNVLGLFPGVATEPPAVALIAHMDTVFPEGTAVEIRREGQRLSGPGVSDNGSGLAALLALAAAMKAGPLRLRAPLLVVSTVGEEGEGDLRGIRHLFLKSEWSSRLGPTLVVDGAGTETIVRQALGSRRFEVTLRGRGGHSWSDFGMPNPIAALARAIAAFYEGEGARVSAGHEGEATRRGGARSTYNIGVISGGTSVNSIPESASMRVDLRSQSAAELDRLEQALRQALAQATRNGAARVAASHALNCEIRGIGDRPAAELAPGARILQVVRAVDAQLEIRSRLHCSSTDANIPLWLGREAVSLGAGGSGGGAHTLNEWFDAGGRELGLSRLLLAAAALAGLEE